MDSLNANSLVSVMAYRGVNQKELAEAIGVSRVTMNRIMVGKVSPTLTTIQKISDALAMTPEQFVDVFMNPARK